MNQSNQLVVNEFESLEATYYSSREKDQTSVTSFLKDYWLSKLASLDIVQQIISSVEVLGRDGRESATQDDNTKKRARGRGKRNLERFNSNLTQTSFESSFIAFTAEYVLVYMYIYNALLRA